MTHLSVREYAETFYRTGWGNDTHRNTHASPNTSRYNGNQMYMFSYLHNFSKGRVQFLPPNFS